MSKQSLSNENTVHVYSSRNSRDGNIARRIPVVAREMLLPFILLTLCFAAWGAAANMTDPLVKVFSKTFSMSSLQAALVQFSYYGAYFCLAIPAALINKHYSYKSGVLVGLGCAIVGAMLFYPASQSMTYEFFLAALFVLAGGLSVLETSANPYVLQMGDKSTATRRLNLAQAFNPVGTNVGVLLATTFILPNLNQADAAQRSTMPEAQLKTIISSELTAVMTPYVGMAAVLLVIWLLIAFTRAPQVEGEQSEPVGSDSGGFGRLFANSHYRFGVLAQFFNVGAQTCVWTFTIQYTMLALDTNEVTGGEVLQYSMILFLVSRFVMTWLMGFLNPARLLMVMSILAAVFCVVVTQSVNQVGVVALIAVSASLSLMFPTIYGISLRGLGRDTKLGAAGLVMAILGGAIMPLFQAGLIDQFNVAISYVVPALCFLVVALFGWYNLRRPA